MKMLTSTTAALAFLAAASLVLAQPPGGGRGGRGGPPPAPPSLMSYDLAMTAIEAAEAEARENNWNVTILVTDQNANAVMMRRLDGASPRTFDIAQSKARAVIGSGGMTSAEYGQKVQAGEIEEVEGAVTFGGGVPVYREGQLIGAVTASGVTPEQDQQVSTAGAEAIGSISAN